MKTLLLYNAHAGRNRARREALVLEAANRLLENGFSVAMEATKAAGASGAQARLAIQSGVEAVFACGGDGTIHDVLQGVAGTGAALGILPFGSANALSRELRLPRDPVSAASLYRPGSFDNVRLASIDEGEGKCRFFFSLAGAGPDGALMYRMLTVDRRHLGRLSYYLHAARLFCTKRFPVFEVSYADENGDSVSLEAVAVMLLRVGRLGGLFSGLARGASLSAAAMRLLIVRPPASVALPLWFLSSWAGATRFNPLLVSANVVQVRIAGEGSGEKVHLQADGEWIGSGSRTISMLDTAVRLLVPPRELEPARAFSDGSRRAAPLP